MRVRLLYFAGLKDALGKSEEQLELPPHVRTVAELTAYLAGARPALGARLSSCRVAVAEEFATPETPLAEGVDVAFIPPVSGG